MAENDEERAAIGRHRAALRVAAGLKQTELADRSGLTERTVREAESGGMLREETARALAQVLGIEVGAYVDPAPMVAPPAPVSS